MAEAPVVHVVHATAPGCHWSWGYEATLNRLRMVYGDAIALHVRLGCPYEDWQQWLREYEMTDAEATRWINEEMGPIMGVSFATVHEGEAPPSVMPLTLAAVAALRQGEEKGWRAHRALLRMYAVEGRDAMARETWLAAGREAGLDMRRFERDLEDTEGLLREYHEQSHAGPPVHVGFYNVIVWDGGNRRVLLDYAFDPQDVEGAIDYLSGGALKKRPVKVDGIPAYLRAHGVAPLAEIGRVFGLGPEQAMEHLERLEKDGTLARRMLAGAPHWEAAGG